MIVVASPNYNAIHKMYGGDPNVPLKAKERTCFYHCWESLQIHRKKGENTLRWTKNGR